MSLPHYAGFVKPWNGRLGVLDASDMSFTDRGSSQLSASSSSSIPETGFCGLLGSGQVYVGVPAMDALCKGLAELPGISGRWGRKVSQLPRAIP